MNKEKLIEIIKESARLNIPSVLEYFLENEAVNFTDADYSEILKGIDQESRSAQLIKAKISEKDPIEKFFDDHPERLEAYLKENTFLGYNELIKYCKGTLGKLNESQAVILRYALKRSRGIFVNFVENPDVEGYTEENVLKNIPYYSKGTDDTATCLVLWIQFVSGSVVCRYLDSDLKVHRKKYPAEIEFRIDDGEKYVEVYKRYCFHGISHFDVDGKHRWWSNSDPAFTEPGREVYYRFGKLHRDIRYGPAVRHEYWMFGIRIHDQYVESLCLLLNATHIQGNPAPGSDDYWENTYGENPASLYTVVDFLTRELDIKKLYPYLPIFFIGQSFENLTESQKLLRSLYFEHTDKNFCLDATEGVLNNKLLARSNVHDMVQVFDKKTVDDLMENGKSLGQKLTMETFASDCGICLCLRDHHGRLVRLLTKDSITDYENGVPVMFRKF